MPNASFIQRTEWINYVTGQVCAHLPTHACTHAGKLFVLVFYVILMELWMELCRLLDWIWVVRNWTGVWLESDQLHWSWIGALVYEYEKNYLNFHSNAMANSTSLQSPYPSMSRWEFGACWNWDSEVWQVPCAGQSTCISPIFNMHAE